jgi:hypothetical protein
MKETRLEGAILLDAVGLTLAQTVKAPSMPGSTSFQADVGPFKIGL